MPTWLQGKKVRLIAFSDEDLRKTILALEKAGFEDIKIKMLFQMSK